MAALASANTEKRFLCMMVPPKRSSVLLSKWNGRFADGIYVDKIERTTAISEIKIDFPRYPA
jgi:hypothetical protein